MWNVLHFVSTSMQMTVNGRAWQHQQRRHYYQAAARELAPGSAVKLDP